MNSDSEPGREQGCLHGAVGLTRQECRRCSEPGREQRVVCADGQDRHPAQQYATIPLDDVALLLDDPPAARCGPHRVEPATAREQAPANGCEHEENRLVTVEDYAWTCVLCSARGIDYEDERTALDAAVRHQAAQHSRGVAS